MNEDKTPKEKTTSDTPAEKTVTTDDKQSLRRNKFGAKKRFEKKRRRGRPERKQEFEQKIADIRRVTRVMAGGRRFSFSITMIVGDKKGRVGVGVGKSGDITLGIDKAVRNAKKNMITIARTESGSIEHDVKAKYGASIIEIRPAKGKGLVAGASVRTVLELAGVTDITAKVWTRSKNKINNSRATIIALSQLEPVHIKTEGNKQPVTNKEENKDKKASEKNEK